MTLQISRNRHAYMAECVYVKLVSTFVAVLLPYFLIERVLLALRRQLICGTSLPLRPNREAFATVAAVPIYLEFRCDYAQRVNGISRGMLWISAAIAHALLKSPIRCSLACVSKAAVAITGPAKGALRLYAIQFGGNENAIFA